MWFKNAFGGAKTSPTGVAAEKAKKDKGQPKEKNGAGILFYAPRGEPGNGEVLLLLRNSRNNGNTWGLPGGNVDLEDGGDLFVTAEREAFEEVGPLPRAYVPLGEVLTRRGKHFNKFYTVYVCQISAEVRASWELQLNHEHSEWRWFAWQALKENACLHPVVRELVHTHGHQMSGILDSEENDMEGTTMVRAFSRLSTGLSVGLK